MKTILLLGGFGFLGTNILKYVDDKLPTQYRFIVFDRYNKHPHNIKFNTIMQVYDGDFSDANVIDTIFAENKIDLVIHAITTTVPALSYNTRYDIESNLLPTIQLLEAMVKYRVKDIVFLSSGGAVYGNGNNQNKHTETDNLYPISSYGVTKLAIEKYMMQYAALYTLKPLILRVSNPYGKYHYSLKQGICNVALRKAHHQEEVSIWGDGEAKKDYIFVEDFCELLFKLYEKEVFGCEINIGSGKVYSVNEILHEIKQLMPDFQWNYTQASLTDVAYVQLDISRLLNIVGNYPFTSLEEGIVKTYNWIKNQ